MVRSYSQLRSFRTSVTQLTRDENIALTRDFCQQLAAHGLVVDWSYHDMPENPHLHVMTNTRELTAGGFGRSKVPILDSDGQVKKSRSGKICYQNFFVLSQDIKPWRKAWAECVNYHLKSAGHDVRIDHRSYAEMDLDIKPQKHEGSQGYVADKRFSDKQAYNDHAKIFNEIIFERGPDVLIGLLESRHSVFTKKTMQAALRPYLRSHEKRLAIIDMVLRSDRLVPLDLVKGVFTTKAMLMTEERMARAAGDLIERTRRQIAQPYCRQHP